MLRITSESRASDAAFRALADAAAAAVGLHLALARPAVAAEVAATLTDGAQVVTEVRMPDVLAAIAIRTFAYAERFAARDAEDLYRLLEVAYASGPDRASWPVQPTFKAAGGRLSTFFDGPGNALAVAMSSRQQQ